MRDFDGEKLVLTVDKPRAVELPFRFFWATALPKCRANGLGNSNWCGST